MLDTLVSGYLDYYVIIPSIFGDTDAHLKLPLVTGYRLRIIADSSVEGDLLFDIITWV